MRRDDDFDADLRGDADDHQGGGHVDASHRAVDDKAAHGQFPELTADQLDQLVFVDSGTHFEQGATYVDLEDETRQPFTALASQSAEAGQRIVAKRDVDHEVWNALVGQGREPEVVRPPGQE